MIDGMIFCGWKIYFQLNVGEKMSDLYNIEDKGDYLVYTFDGIALKIKSIKNRSLSERV